jgi:hypothetical protein
MDSLAGDLVIAEAAEDLSAIYDAQLLAYLRLGGKPVGLLGDFNVRVPRQGLSVSPTSFRIPPGLRRLCREIPDAPALP